MDKGDKNKDWVRLASKSRVGRFYLFNKSTGETKWLSQQGEDTLPNNIVSPPKLSVNKVSKTPAQDRLKRLQHCLKISQTKDIPPSKTHHSSEAKASSSKVQKNYKDEAPSSSRTTRNSSKKFTKVEKRLDSVVPVKSAAPTDKTLDKPPVTETFPLSDKTTADNIKIDLENLEHNSSRLKILRSGIVKKIKDICKAPFANSKKSSDEKILAKDAKKSPGLINTTKFKATQKATSKQSLATQARQHAIIKQLKDEESQSLETQTLTNRLMVNSSNSFSLPSYSRGSANLRLERLKQSLISQQRDQQETGIEINTKAITNNSKQIKAAEVEATPTTSVSNKNDDIEAMDWQPIIRNEEASEECRCEPTFVVEKSKKLSLKGKNFDNKDTMGDIIDTVNENLLRFSAEKQKDSGNNKKWLKNFFYFIVDTNVLLRDLTFVEDLSNMKLCDTKGSMLYIPYSVLQELDKLKMRSGAQESVKTFTVRAIKYLNSKFESKSPNLQAQSALDERKRLIDIGSADDSIINCCLQVKEHVPNVLLLTEDINLRNKAICNNIMVSTKSDLMAKRFDTKEKS